MKIDKKKMIEFNYKNYKGILSKRKVQPTSILFKSTQWHLSEQWIMQAFDVEKNEMREFALKDIVGLDLKTVFNSLQEKKSSLDEKLVPKDLLIPLELFVSYCNNNSIMDDDGSGYYSDGETCSEEVLPSEINAGTINNKYKFVVWYNK